MSTDPFDDDYKDLGELTAEMHDRNQDDTSVLTGEPTRLTVAEMAAGQAARIDPPTEARVQEAANHRVGSRRDTEIAELKARLDKMEGKVHELEGELDMAMQVLKLRGDLTRGVTGLVGGLQGDVHKLSTYVDAKLEVIAELQNHTQITAEQLAERCLENKSLRDALSKEREARTNLDERLRALETDLSTIRDAGK